MTYKKGKDGNIKNIEQLDNVQNRGIEIIYKCNEPKCIEAGGDYNIGDNISYCAFKGNKPEGFEGW